MKEFGDFIWKEIDDGRHGLEDNEGFLLIKKFKNGKIRYIPKVFKTVSKIEKFIKKNHFEHYDYGICSIYEGDFQNPKIVNIHCERGDIFLRTNDLKRINKTTLEQLGIPH